MDQLTTRHSVSVTSVSVQNNLKKKAFSSSNIPGPVIPTFTQYLSAQQHSRASTSSSTEIMSTNLVADKMDSSEDSLSNSVEEFVEDLKKSKTPLHVISSSGNSRRSSTSFQRSMSADFVPETIFEEKLTSCQNEEMEYPSVKMSTNLLIKHVIPKNELQTDEAIAVNNFVSHYLRRKNSRKNLLKTDWRPNTLKTNSSQNSIDPQKIQLQESPKQKSNKIEESTWKPNSSFGLASVENQISHDILQVNEQRKRNQQCQQEEKKEKTEFLGTYETFNNSYKDFSAQLTSLRSGNRNLKKLAIHAETSVDEMTSGLSQLRRENHALYVHLNRTAQVIECMKQRASVLKTVAKDKISPNPETLSKDSPKLKVPKRKPLTENATFFAVGQNDDGQLGMNNDEYNGGIPCTFQFKLVNMKKVKEDVIKISCGGMHVVGLTAAGQLISWGCADFSGTSRVDNWEPQHIHVEEDGIEIEFVDIVCGECYSAAIDNIGRVWSWGTFRNTVGEQHYNEVKTRCQEKPKVLAPILYTQVAKIAAGESHFVVLCTDGTVWGWGLNSHGQLGRLSTSQTRDNIYTGLPVSLPAGFIPRSIFACGFSTFISGEYPESKGKTVLIACGGNGFGELGIGSENPQWYLKQVDGMKNIIDIQGGLHHTVALDDKGTVWVAGRGDSGQLGLGNRVIHSNRFTKLEFDDVASQICCSTSGNQSYFIAKGKMYATGYNCYGQLGLKHENEVYIPNLVPLKGRKALFVAAGSQFCIMAAGDKD
ncbi:hypothetical protein HK100_011853 [Physocladia obscura]|uniref:RCC1-like domain-containing protein n=1 Tax=Physocladia obscura TaxID=109957 RepID=A0AAD5T0P5_9FUNG|nr:hypothetical protein HK100_011853 [Physocladia obscura]